GSPCPLGTTTTVRPPVGPWELRAAAFSPRPVRALHGRGSSNAAGTPRSCDAGGGPGEAELLGGRLVLRQIA
ncbi:MAG: hypothetical protein WAL35_02055, partial [Acidimicrobiales bacterium]